MREVRCARVFLSSPSDVAVERDLARQLLKEELPYRGWLDDGLTFEVISWDDPAAQLAMCANETPQESINRTLPRPADCDIVIVILWSRMGTPLPPAIRKPNGDPYLSGTEWEFEDAFNAPLKPLLWVYRRTEESLISMRDPQRKEKQEQFERVEAFFAQFRNEDGSAAGGFHTYETPSDFKNLLSQHMDKVRRQLLSRLSPVPVATEQEPLPVLDYPPYPGLRPFEKEEDGIFFGRDREIDGLVTRLRDPNRRFLAIVGASGTGKSSLVRAGLLPRLKKDAIEGSGDWRVLPFKPGELGDDPFLALANAIAGRLPPRMRQRQIKLARALAEAPSKIGIVINTILDAESAAVLLLFVDQFEELFNCSKKVEQLFIDVICHAVRDRRVRVLATLRMDVLPQALQHPRLADLLANGIFTLGPPGPRALDDMIRLPAQRAGVTLEDRLIDKMLEDAGGEPGTLPLVAFCLHELYSRCSGPANGSYGKHVEKKTLSAEAYESLGRLKGAVGRHAERLLKESFRDEWPLLGAAWPRLFRALVYVDVAGTKTRRTCFRDELCEDPLLQLLAEKLIEGRLLLAASIGERATIVLAHDALFEAWPTLTNWIRDNQERLKQFSKAQLLLEDADPQVRLNGIRKVCGLKGMVEEAVPVLVAALGDTDPEVREGAADALGDIGPAAVMAVPALIRALDNPSSRVRKGAVEALGQMGPAAAEAVPGLVTALRDASGSVQDSAVEALEKIGTESMTALISVLSDPCADPDPDRCWRFQWRVRYILEKFGAAAVPALEAAQSAAEPKPSIALTETLRDIRAAIASVPH